MIAKHIGARSDQGPFRSTNQDAYWVSDTSDPLDLGELFIVTDGVGGQEFGAVAAQLAAQVISTDFYRLRQDGESVPDALKQAIQLANEAVFNEAQERGGIKMGCTVVAAVWHQKILYVAHVGDARIYLLHKNNLQQLTRDDSWVQRQIDAGIITPEEAENHEFRNVVTQALGNKLEIIIHQSQHQNVRPQDRLLLCTDGLHGVLSDAELTRTLKIDPPQAAADTLIQKAIDAHTEDNVTAVVVQLNTEAGVAVAPAAAAGGGSMPRWAIVALVILALLALAWGIYTLWPAPAPAADPLQEVLPTIAATALSPTQPPPSPTAVLPTETPTELLPTAAPPTEELPPTVAPTQAPPPTAVETAAPSPPPPLRGRITEYGFVWSDANIQANDCNQTTNLDIPVDATVLILEATPISAQPDTSCTSSEFVKIQLESDPDVTGWVLERIVDKLSPDN